MAVAAPDGLQSPPAGPTPVSQRILAPDLARGFALLLVALAHSTGILNGTIPGVDLSPHGLERPYLGVLILLVHACALPLFSLMFGYGLVQFVSHQDSAGVPRTRTRAVLLRRHGWLLLVAAVHGTLLFVGDVLGAFAIVGLLFTLLLLRRGRLTDWLGVIYLAYGAMVVVGLAVLVYSRLLHQPGTGEVPVGDDTTLTLQSYPDSVLARLQEWPLSTMMLLATGLFALIGVWAARRRILEEPTRHRRMLYAGLVGGFTIGILGALPMALTVGGYVHLGEESAGLAKITYESAGLFGAIGYVSLFGLISAGIASRSTERQSPRGPFTRALVALGQRSLSFYLFQSVAWLILFSPYTLGIGADASSPTFLAAACAFGVWVLSLVIASGMQKRGFRGPVELLMRRLTYGSR